MKKLIFYLTMTVCVFLCKDAIYCVSSNAQNYLNLYQNNGSTETYSIPEVRKITYDTVNVMMNLHKTDGYLKTYLIKDIQKITLDSLSLDATITAVDQTINTLSDTVYFNVAGISLSFDSLNTILPDTAFVTVTHHESTMATTSYPDTTITADSIATIFNNFYWNITSNIDTFQTRICFQYDTTQLNTSYINYLSLVYQEQLENPWQMINSVPEISDTTVCFITDHWSNWALAITKADAKVKADTSLSNFSSEKISVYNEFGNSGMSLTMKLAPLEVMTASVSTYDMNPGGDLPSGALKFLNTFWELKTSNTDSMNIYLDMVSAQGYQPSYNNNYRILYRPDAITDWQTLPSLRVKRGTKELIVSEGNNVRGHYILAETDSPTLLFNDSVSVSKACAGDIVQFTSYVMNGQPPYTYQWSGEDGFSATGQNPTHVYASPGTYSFKLTAEDANGAVTEYEDSVNIPLLPLVDFSSNVTQIDSGGTVSFVSFPQQPVISYLWYFGDGDSSTQKNPLHKYDSMGTFTVTLIITDTTLCSSSMVKTGYIKVDRLIDIAENINTGQIQLYPVPAKDYLIIIGPIQFVNGKFSIVDITGKEILKINTTAISNKSSSSEASYRIDILDLAKGFYLLKVGSDAGARMLGFQKIH